MPKRTDIKSILVIGSGPIVIGQACEFDYSGTQAIKALREDGYRVILLNSNPATIMTDPQLADVTYIEPIVAEVLEAIIVKERPDAILPTMGGQTALNVTLDLDESGILKKYGVEILGAVPDSIRMAEDRELFKRAMEEIGLNCADSRLARSVKDAENFASEIGYPLILRPSRTLGGSGGGIAYDLGELRLLVAKALSTSPNNEVLVEQSLIGWKEIELEVVSDAAGNGIIVCGIENFDPMGVHTGDSITVAPIQTLTDKEYQLLREMALKILRKIGVATGGANVQFAINPKSGKIIVIEMNPRVSRSSALASKATGFPIAKIAAKLAVGYTLDELPNDITRETPACFEPSIDYVVVKIPRFNFDKFPLAAPKLGTQMKSIGEVLSFGRTFKEALQKAICSLENDTYGFDYEITSKKLDRDQLLQACAQPAPERLWLLAEALRAGISAEELARVSFIDLWFIEQINQIVNVEGLIKREGVTISAISREKLNSFKELGFSDKRLAQLLSTSETDLRQRRLELQITPNFKGVDSCAAEFVAYTPYLYSSYDRGSEIKKLSDRSVVILGSGPNRIGQGVEFDYCCVHGVFAAKELGYKVIMVNCNPETVSTDYDISDRLYFEPLILETVLQIVAFEKPLGVILQFGGQTPLKLANDLVAAGVKILGTSSQSIDIAEDRELFSQLIKKLDLRQPESACARSAKEALTFAATLGYPIIVRPSFVLGGRSMRIVYTADELAEVLSESIRVSNDRPILLDRFLRSAIEIDVDCVRDGVNTVIAGIMEHIEPAGIHSGDSSCAIPPFSLGREIIEELESQAKRLANALNVVGLMNVQFAVTVDRQIYILEANPRASRTIPFVSKATGIPWAKVATNVMLGVSLQEQGLLDFKFKSDYSATKACVFPFKKFGSLDPLLGPEMKSTGEVMGIGGTFEESFVRAQIACQINLPTSGGVFVSVADHEKGSLPEMAELIRKIGFQVYATEGSGKILENYGLKVEILARVNQGSPNVIDVLNSGGIDLLINVPQEVRTYVDSRSIRVGASELDIPIYTTSAAAIAALKAILSLKANGGVVSPNFGVKSLQEYLARAFVGCQQQIASVKKIQLEISTLEESIATI
ncbi:MAG TPA: carbamoyl-phosphate synthase large subunit [Oligoflexia bacterium]|nr:carbamoyl-phosphate synthase large subunit [Oligoflexia bacterium]HMP27716.1 carbamoyl-phosphate synthase large subunit [Oligoflexia bacterium]